MVHIPGSVEKMFILVEFTDDCDMAVIPDNWLEGTSCAVWPDFKSDAKIKKAVRSKLTPDHHWKAFPIRELYKDESYDKVYKKMKIAEVQSDLQTADSSDASDDNEKRRRSKRKRRATTFSSDDDDDIENSVGRTAVRPFIRKLSSPPRRLPTPPRQNLSNHHLQLQQQAILHQPTPVSVNSKSPRSVSPLPLLQRPTARFGRERPTESASPIQSAMPATPRHSSAPSPQHLSPVTPTRQTGFSTPNIPQARDIRLFTLLEKIKQEQAQQRGMLESILQLLQSQPGIQNDVDRSIPDEVDLPLNTEEAVNGLESRLGDKTVETGLVNYLSTLGGKDVNETIRRVLKHVLRNSLAEKYNWFGKKGKLEFGKLKIAGVVFISLKLQW